MTDRKYTPAQRRALLALTVDWKSNPAGVNYMQCHALARRHPDICQRLTILTLSGDVWQWRLTPAGLAEKEKIMTNDRG